MKHQTIRVIIGLLLLVSQSLVADPVLDQEYGLIDKGGYGSISFNTKAQTFTVGLDGYLTGFEIPLTGVGTATFEIHRTVNGRPVFGSTPIATSTIEIELTQTPTWFFFDISAFGISVYAGEMLALVTGVFTGNDSPVNWRGAGPSIPDPRTYDRGAFYSTTFQSPSSYLLSSSYSVIEDYSFRTYVYEQPPSDSDGDGIADINDFCQFSSLNASVVVGSCDSSVTNKLDVNGCTIIDKIEMCKDINIRHGHFINCVDKLTKTLRSENIINISESGSIKACSATSNK